MSDHPIAFSFQLQFAESQETRVRQFAQIVGRAIDVAGGNITSTSNEPEADQLVTTFVAEVEKPLDFWSKVKPLLPFEEMQRAECAVIIVCEGSDGWSNYLLLHHYDKDERVESHPFE